jgi:hypothetical protein
MSLLKLSGSFHVIKFGIRVFYSFFVSFILDMCYLIIVLVHDDDDGDDDDDDDDDVG